jgi:hypothetical protein
MHIRSTFRVTTQAKAKSHARFASALHHLDDLGREPAWREEECLFHALGYMKRGNYKLADAELKQLAGLFAGPPDLGEPPKATRERYTIELLKRGLAQLRAE